MSDPYSPPDAPLREELAPARRWRNASAGLLAGIIVLAAVNAALAGGRFVGLNFLHVGMAILLPSLFAGLCMIALPRVGLRWVILLASGLSLVAFYFFIKYSASLQELIGF
jgi:hypothetical protein